MRNFTFLSTVVIATMTFAQESIPKAVTTQITGDTVAVIRADLKSLDISAIDSLLQDWPDPMGMEVVRGGQLVAALKKLKELAISDVFLILEATDIPSHGLLLVPTSDSKPVLEALKTVWPQDVVETTGAVVAGSESVRRRIGSGTPAHRPEFTAGLQSISSAPLQIVIAPGNDTRRAIREFLPKQDAELPSDKVSEAVDRSLWLALGISLPPRFETKMVVQTKDAAAAQSIQKLVSSAITIGLNWPEIKKLAPNAVLLQDLLIPRQNADRLIVELNDANGGAQKLLDQVATPLAAAARANADRRRVLASLKQLALAMHNYHDAKKAFPPQALLSADGSKKLLSWRVLILPYVGEGALFQQFHLDESWDSPHNKSLIERMPAIYLSSKTTLRQRAQGLTGFQVPIGEKTPFGGSTGVKITDITDGTSNTIMIVDVLPEQATIWTKPDDLIFDPKDPWHGLAAASKEGFWAAFCDGSVRRIMDVTAENLRRYMQMNDGEPINQ